MFKVLCLTLSLAAINFTSQAMDSEQSIYSGSEEVIKMRVNAHQVDCHPEADMTPLCYSVQKGASIGMDNWEVLQQSIEGFNFEEGYTYDLIVKIEFQQGKTGPERFKYTLVEIISKTKES